MTGETTIELMPPDKLKRTDDMGFAGGPSFSRVVAINAGEFWEDSTNRGGGGFMARAAGAGGRADPAARMGKHPPKKIGRASDRCSSAGSKATSAATC